MKLDAKDLVGEKGHEASDAIGTLHFAHCVPFENNHLGFFTIFDGDIEKYFQDFADKTSFIFDTLFPHVVGAPPTPVAKNAQAFYQWGVDNNHPPIGFYSAYPGLSVLDIRALLADRKSTSGCRLDSSRARGREVPMKGPGLVQRLLGGKRHEPQGSDGDSGVRDGSALDLADIQGFVLRAYTMPMVRHFLLTVGAPAQARRQLARLVSGDESDVPQITTAEDWHVGFAPGPGDDLADAPRRTPDYCLNIGITWPGLVALEVEATRANALVRVLRRVRRRSRATRGAGRRHRSKFARELDRRFRKWGRSRPGDAARHQPGGDDALQRPVVCLVLRRRCLPRALAPGRNGVDGAARRPTRADGQSALRIYRRHHDAHHSRRPGELSARSPGTLRAVALRLAGRCCELRRTGAAQHSA